MSIVGVDYGIRKLALVALDERSGPLGAISCFWGKHLSYNQILTEASAKASQMLDTVLNGASPTTVAIEYPFFAANAKTAVRMAMMAGVLYSTLATVSDDVDFVEPATWKKSIVGHGRADKQTTMLFLREHHAQLTFRNDDEADAWCMALYAQGKR